MQNGVAKLLKLHIVVVIHPDRILRSDLIDILSILGTCVFTDSDFAESTAVELMVYINAAAISDDGESSAGIGIQPGIEGGNAAVFIAQQHCIGQVHASLLIKAAGHMDLGGIFPEKIGRLTL